MRSRIALRFATPQTTGQAPSALSPRVTAPREAISDAWSINLTPHVEPRLESQGRQLGLFAIGFLVSVGAVIAGLGAGGAWR